MMALLLLLTGLVYLRGWLVLHRTAHNLFPVWRLVSFLSGLVLFLIAIASPLDALSGLLLSAHMIQHLLLLTVSPPLLLLGAPLLPLMRGFPRTLARDGLGPFMTSPALKRFGRAMTHPVVCWLLMAVILCAWHLPAAFQLALRSRGWHQVEHACFFGSALLFWWSIIRPFPSRPQWSPWLVLLSLLAADVLNTALSTVFTFSDRVLYPVYAEAPRLFGTTALGDQNCAGVIMWVPGSLVFLIPAVLIAIQYLTPSHLLVRPQRVHPSQARTSVALVRQLKPWPAATTKGFDLLSVPVVGPFLRAQSTRRFMQAALLIIAIAVILDGLFGPQVSSTNLAGVLPWTYWRGFVVVALLAAGNFFCMACPFMLFRELGRRIGLRQRAWPQALRSKWFAILLLALFFWGYEAFGLWDKPIWTAWLILNYFLAAFAMDALFRGASFCKYVCPIGQFQFVASLVSPLEVKVREPAVCASCKTHDCLRGNEHHRGCEMDLHLPRKFGNLDCTFCLDCVRACPHDNVGVMAVVPGMDVIRDPQRSSVGRLSRRRDIAALALVFVFAAFANAALMVTPISRWRDRIATDLKLESSLPVTSALFFFALILAPLILVGGSVLTGRAMAALKIPAHEMMSRFSLALVPLATAMWAAHFLFHFLGGWNSAWPVIQRAIGDLGLIRTNEPAWPGANLYLKLDDLRMLQTVLLDIGLLATLYIGWRIARVYAPKLGLAFRMMAPWSCVAVTLYSFGIWTFLQPMEMRGMTNPLS
jgi:cytochrome c oxidase assembly factor CtaG